MGSASVALLPIDLSYASLALSCSSSSSGGDEAKTDGCGTEADGVGNEEVDTYLGNPTYFPWTVTYWTTFFLAWLVLPITRQSLLSGHFTLCQRVKDGLRRSFRAIFLMITTGIVAVIALAIHLRSVDVTIISSVLMTMANTYGLVLVAFLLGNGMVSIPKKLWREACPAKELRRTRIMAPIFEEELFEAVMGLEDMEDKIEKVCRMAVSLRENGDEGEMDNEEEGVSIGSRPTWGRAAPRRCGVCCRVDQLTEFHECLEALVRRKNETVDLCAERRTSQHNRRNSQHDTRNGDAGDGREINTMDVNYLVLLNGQLKQAQERATSAQLRWNKLMKHSCLFSALMDDGTESRSGGDGIDVGENIGSGSATLLPSSQTLRCCPKLCYSFQRIWVRCLRYPAYRAAALVTLSLSASVLLGEVTLAAPYNLSPFSWTLHALDHYHEYWTSGWAQVAFQICALIPLLYMSLCVYTSLFQMSLLGPYCLRGNRQSAGVALVFNAQYLVRLQFPLGYNYLLM